MAVDLITAYHVLHKHRVVDEYGSISIRNPDNSNTFIIGAMPAVLISSLDDLVERNVEDGTLHQRLGRSESLPQHSFYPEHFLHGSIYAQYSDVQSVIHAQSTVGIVYGLCDSIGSMMLPVHNRAGFVGEHSPIFNPASHYSKLPSTHPQDLTISHPLLGEEVAHCLAKTRGVADGEQRLPEYSCVMLRGNGVAIWGDSLQHAVYKAVQLQRSTEVQTMAMMQRAHSELGITYLSDHETKDCEYLMHQVASMHWAAWTAEVERDPTYSNRLRSS